MAFLTGNTVQSTYKSLIKVDDNGELSATTPKTLTDGAGNSMPLQAAQNQIKFTGILDADSATSILGFDAPKNIIIDGVGTWTADQAEDTVTFAGGTGIDIALAGDTITWTFDGGDLGYASEAFVLAQTASLSASLAVDIAANTADIATNTGNISTNSGLISANATDISNMLSGIGNVISVNGVDGAITIDAGAGINVNTNAVTGQVTISNTATTDTGSLLVTASSDFSVLTFEKGDASTFEVDVTPREVIESVINKEAVLLSKGTPVYVSGSTGNASHVYLADASDANKVPASFVLKQDLASNAEGFGLALGFINGVDTSGFNAADTIYLAVGGGYTNVAPTGSANFIQRLGNVIKVDATNGSGVFTGAGAVRGLPNIQSGYTWVGDADGVPQPVATSSFSGLWTLNGSNIYYNAGNVGIGLNNPTENLHIFSSDAPTALFQSDVPYALVTFMDEATTNATTVGIGAEENDLVFRAGSSYQMALTDTGKLGVGTTTPTEQLTLTQNAEIAGTVDAKGYLYDYNSDAGTTTYRGDIIKLGTTATTAGSLYAWNGTNWVLADADVENTAQALLGIATANTSDKGMLINGYYKDASTFSAGQLYMSATAGDITSTPPSTTGQFVRIIGHGLGSNVYRFNPSNDYYTVE